jgi:hypothetical protein
VSISRHGSKDKVKKSMSTEPKKPESEHSIREDDAIEIETVPRHSILLKAARTPFVQNKADYGEK